MRVSPSSLRDRYEKREAAHPERTAFAVRRNAKAFRSWVAGASRFLAHRAGLGRYVPALAVLLAPSLALGQAYRHPVYVGVEVCASCHRGAGMGHQHSRWLLSKHAAAYTALAKPEAKNVARLSGIPQEPQGAAMCLGCHATGAEAERWEKDDTFRTEDGVQCEKCHGAGSEYLGKQVMMDRRAAVSAGLRLPTARDCLGCHRLKGSHRGVSKQSKFSVEQALRTIEHRTPRVWRMARPPATGEWGKPGYVGSAACGKCHKGPRMGYQFSKWLSSGHARAYAVLSNGSAPVIAKKMGVKADPQDDLACLKCHATTDRGAGIYEGVGCEGCHGAGSEYALEAVMKDERAAHMAGLAKVTRDTCIRCHETAHGKPFDYEKALAKIAHPTHLPEVAEGLRYKTPLNLALSPDGQELYVACEASHTVIVVDTAEQRKVAEIAVGHHPADVTFSPDGTRAYVSNRLDDSVSVVHVAARKVIATIPVGDEPHGVLTDRSGRLLYVLDTSSDSISVVDTTSLKEVKRLTASRSPWSLSLSPDGARIYVTNTLSRFVKERTPPMSEVTVIDTARAVVEDRHVLPATNLLAGIDWHPTGRFAFVTMNRTKNLIPITRLLQGWTITNGLGIVWRDGRVAQVLLDEPHLCFPDAADVAFTPDGRLALVTSSGSDRVAFVDVQKLIAMVGKASEHERTRVLPNHLGKATEFVVAHVPTGCSPRGIAVTPDGKTAYVTNALDDSLTVIDIAKRKTAKRVDLGGPKAVTKVRWGERLFHSADITFHRQFSCHTCHPDGHVDGLTYDIEPDGLGMNPVDNRTLRGILDTAPFKWTGLNPSLSRQCGPRLSVFFTRLRPYTPEELSALTEYICTIPRPPNRYRPLGARLTEAQRRGRIVFERTRTNAGRLIPKRDRCVTCHSPPLYTDRMQHDVGTKLPLDTKGKFDTPHLNNIYDSAPYLHNGIAETLEEIWTRYNPDDKHGVTNDLTKDQLNDLIEYLKTL